MKQGIHPDYREVVFVDLSNDFKFITRSTVQTRETTKWTDGKEYPLYKLDTSSRRIRFTPANKSWWIPRAVSRNSVRNSAAKLARARPRVRPRPKAPIDSDDKD